MDEALVRGWHWKSENCSSQWTKAEKLPAYQQTFFRDIASEICKKTRSTEIFAAMAIAQAALESNWGRTSNKTLFGIKGKGKTLVTHEVINGIRVKIEDSFSSAQSIDEAVEQYINFLRKNKRYSTTLKAKDVFTQINELKKAGYATDPAYATKLASIVKHYKLDERYPNE
jgi:flagellar protein FlgJ